jgi:hypothetical protein
MQEPQDVSAGNLRTGIHLPRAPAGCLQNMVRQTLANRQYSITAASIYHNDFGLGRKQAQMFQKSADNRGFIQHRDDN